MLLYTSQCRTGTNLRIRNKKMPHLSLLCRKGTAQTLGIPDYRVPKTEVNPHPHICHSKVRIQKCGNNIFTVFPSGHHWHQNSENSRSIPRMGPNRDLRVLGRQRRSVGVDRKTSYGLETLTFLYTEKYGGLSLRVLGLSILTRSQA